MQHVDVALRDVRGPQEELRGRGWSNETEGVRDVGGPRVVVPAVEHPQCPCCARRAMPAASTAAVRPTAAAAATHAVVRADGADDGGVEDRQGGAVLQVLRQVPQLVQAPHQPTAVCVRLGVPGRHLADEGAASVRVSVPIVVAVGLPRDGIQDRVGQHLELPDVVVQPAYDQLLAGHARQSHHVLLFERQQRREVLGGKTLMHRETTKLGLAQRRHETDVEHFPKGGLQQVWLGLRQLRGQCLPLPGQHVQLRLHPLLGPKTHRQLTA
mmetsp:Transcript_151988/g.487947  ORF Transcript_151988/g.487947 Transcript_151988/m.487947 type:complete len:269 (-) Transcript_151988:1456-2262(-)